MTADIRAQTKEIVDQVPEKHLPAVLRWLEQMVECLSDPDFDPSAALLLETEEEWEERVLTETLGDALNPDGSIDYEKLDLVDASLDE
jgi:hypothetical protein